VLKGSLELVIIGCFAAAILVFDQPARDDSISV